jgi:hypothetical protein
MSAVFDRDRSLNAYRPGFKGIQSDLLMPKPGLKRIYSNPEKDNIFPEDA